MGRNGDEVVCAFLLALFLAGCGGFIEAQVRAKALRSESRLRTLMEALDAYEASNGLSPLQIDAITTPASYITSIYYSRHTWPNKWQIEPAANSLETHEQTVDPFDKDGQVYYWSNGQIYILAFSGPDRRLQVKDLDLPTRGRNLDVAHLRAEICGISYDPTNGVCCPGKDYAVLGPERAEDSFVPDMLRSAR